MITEQAGVTEEMLDDTLEMDEDEEIEEEADAEVDKVLFELTNGKLGEARPAGTELPVRSLHCRSLVTLAHSCTSRCKIRSKRKRRRE
jgi:hypothetical protein